MISIRERPTEAEKLQTNFLFALKGDDHAFENSVHFYLVDRSSLVCFGDKEFCAKFQ